MADRPLLPNGLPDVQRLITTHDASGKAIFVRDIPSTSSFQEVGPAFQFFLGYTTKGLPVDMNAPNEADAKADAAAVPKDIQRYTEDLQAPPAGLSIDNGTALRFVDFAPAAPPFMHRTESLDYGVVLEGVMECILDSGETRIMRRGDVCVQRGTMHAWKNVTEDGGWARMLFSLVAAEKVVVGGQALGADLSGEAGEKGVDG
ncbi:hypothetical protein LZ554_007304 [Drepanopeziza brunnea f. sp. 'monogermtubi']|nr:hypothetical protein LZ554_007304 [Drepanopeziza brunnea f. sp. 'monogermtubi']